MKREEIDKNYCWDLKSVYLTPKLATDDLNKLMAMIKELKEFKGKLTSKENLVEFLKIKEKADIIHLRIYSYSRQGCDVELNNQDFQHLFSEIINLGSIFEEAISFFEPELINNRQNLKNWLENDTDYLFANKMVIDKIIRREPHINSTEIEEILAQIPSFGENSHLTFTTIRPVFDPVTIDGKDHFLNHATLSQFLENPNQEIRQQAYEKFYSVYKKMEHTFATTLIGHIKYSSFMAKQSKFKTALDASLFKDNSNTQLFEMILEMANDKYLHLFHQFIGLKKKILKLDKLYNYDLYAPLIKDVDLKFKVEEAKEILLAAFAPLGKEYLKIVEKAFEEKWIDFYTHEGKRDGAYSFGSYDTKPFILMNWVDKYHSLMTLAHELGHSIHTYYSNLNNSFNNSNYSIFVAEVVSSVNEVLLINYLLKKYEGDKKVKSYILAGFLDEAVGMIFRQPFFAKFESDLYHYHESGNALSAKYINEHYHASSKKYFGKDVELSPFTQYSCYHVPHFYYNFYVYKYTIGMCSALAITKRILSDDKDQIKKYLEFLTLGSTMWPIEELKHAKVDPLDSNVYSDAFDYFAQLLKEFEESSLK